MSRLAEVTFHDSWGTTQTIVDAERWREVVDENRPCLESGTRIVVRIGSDKRAIHREKVA